MNTVEKTLNEMANNIGAQDIVDQYSDTNEQNNDEEVLFDSQSFSLDVTLVRVRMKERNLTLTAVQEQLGVAYRTVIRWLNKDDFPQHKNLVKLADVLDIEPYQLVYRWRKYGNNHPNENNDALRYIQRRIETIVTQIMDDKETPKEKKLDALVKYHNILLKATK